MPPRYAPKNPYYNETLVTVWQTAFTSLAENSALLLGLVCFFAPDNIPRMLINTSEPVSGTWPFLTDMEEYVCEGSRGTLNTRSQITVLVLIDLIP